MEYNTALYDFLKLPPDPCTQSYTDVTTQIYPLRADPRKIKDFCDTYLNIGAPNEFFEPAGPWVLLQVVDYGRMDFAGTKDSLFAHKWFAQHEVAFGIPLRCSRGKDGSFEEFGVVYPFIWVDNPLSMESGRQIYGWPKAGMHIETTPPQFQPNNPRILVSARVSPFLHRKEGGKSPDTPFVEIRQTRPFLSGRAGIADTITSVPRAVSGYFSVASSVLQSMSDFAGLVAGFKLPTTGTLSHNFATIAQQIQSLGNTLQKGFGYFNSMIPMLIGTATGSQKTSTNPKITIYTMKQVRDTDDTAPKATSNACYQAIVRSEMTVDQVQDGGLLFDPLSGDPSGGIQISLSSKGNDYVQALIDMVSPWGTTSEDMLCVNPLVPFWEKVDLSYGLADRQSWHTKVTDWQEESNKSTVALSIKAARANKQITYQTRGTGSALAVAGTREAKNAVLHLFMLKADQNRLQTLVDSYVNELNKPNKDAKTPCFRFEVKPYNFVYGLLLSYDDMKIGTEKASYGDTVLTFAVLAEYKELGADGVTTKFTNDAFIPLYTFVGTDWNFVTEYEVYGRLAFKSTLDSPEDTWVRQAAPSGDFREVLSVSTTLFPTPPKEQDGSAGAGIAAGAVNKSAAAGAVKGAMPVKVMALYSKPSFTLPDSSTTAPSGTKGVTQNSVDSYLERYGLEKYLTKPNTVIGNEQQPDSIALKQVRNAIHGQQADYQSLVAVQRSFTLEDSFGQSSVKIRIYEQAAFPLVDKLGLQPEPDGDSSFKEFKADALSFTGTVKEQPGRELWRRVAPDEVWKKV
jgi:hypothetical protein